MGGGYLRNSDDLLFSKIKSKGNSLPENTKKGHCYFQSLDYLFRREGKGREVLKHNYLMRFIIIMCNFFFMNRLLIKKLT